jgi:hypothetical protein
MICSLWLAQRDWDRYTVSTSAVTSFDSVGYDAVEKLTELIGLATGLLNRNKGQGVFGGSEFKGRQNGKGD